MIEQINEPVEVMVTYKNSKTMPIVMGWQNRIYRFTRLGFVHPTREGRKLIHVFSVSDDNLTYRLEFDTESLSWKLAEISDGLPV